MARRALIGAVITVLVTEPLRERLIPILIAMGSKKRKSIVGVWRGTFYSGVPRKSYVEYIELRARLGLMVGRIVSNPENYLAIKSVEDQKPLRVGGAVKDNLFFSGTWFHPIQTSHHTGTFDLLISRGHDQMVGRWLGFSENRREIEGDEWIWQRIEPDPG